jgi:hypothetical protein
MLWSTDQRNGEKHACSGEMDEVIHGTTLVINSLSRHYEG